MSKKVIFFLLLSLTTIVLTQCGKKDPLCGCKEKGTQLECEMDGTLIKADSISAIYQLSNRHLYLYFRNADTSATSLISIYYPLQSLDLPIVNKDTFGRGKSISFYNGVVFGVTNGNIKLEYRADSTICGEFFYADQNRLNVNQGWFSNLRVYAKP